MKKNVWIVSRLSAVRRDKGLDSKLPSFLRALKTTQVIYEFQMIVLSYHTSPRWERYASYVSI